MEEKLILRDGTELEGHLLETEAWLFLYIKGISLADAFRLLIEPENTQVIRAEQYGTETTVRGYRRLCSISDEAMQICAGLKKN